jgi:hypothetical protein
MYWAAVAVLRMLASPVLAMVFVISGLLAPHRRPRWALLVAAGMEGTVAAYAMLHWFAGCRFI